MNDQSNRHENVKNTDDFREDPVKDTKPTSGGIKDEEKCIKRIMKILAI